MAGQLEAPAVAAAVTLRVTDLERSLAFYTQVLGMQMVGDSAAGCTVGSKPDGRRACLVCWQQDGGGAAVELLQVGAGGEGRTENDKYGGSSCKPDTRRDAWVWLGLGGIPDVDSAVAGLVAAGAQDARVQGQFLDIGYVGHLPDPDGYMLEVLQTVMEKSFRPELVPVPAPTALRAVAPAITQFKMNITDPKRSLAFYRDGLGMRLLSKQDAAPYKFTVDSRFLGIP